MTDHSSEESLDGVFRAALDALVEPVLLYDDCRILYANPAACRVLGGADCANIEGVSVDDFILPDLAEVNNARRAYVMQQGMALHDLVVKVRGLDGKPTVLHVDIRPIQCNGATVALATLARR